MERRSKLKVGDPTDFTNFTSAVIDEKAFARISGWIEYAKKSKDLEIIGGGKYDDRLVFNIFLDLT